jgi:hypothetical protein
LRAGWSSGSPPYSETTSASSRRPKRLLAPLRDREAVQPPALSGVFVEALRPRRELVGVLEDAVADVAPVGVGLVVGVGRAVEPVDLLAARKVAAVHDLLLQAEVLGKAPDRRLVVVDEGSAVLADETVAEVAPQAPAAAAEVRRVGLVDGGRDPRAAGPEQVRAANARETRSDDRHPGRRGGAGRLREHARAGKGHPGGGRLGQQPAAGEAPFLGELAPLAGNLVDRNPALLRLLMGGDQLPEASRDGRVGDGSRSVSLAHRQLLASENPEPATLLSTVWRF